MWLSILAGLFFIAAATAFLIGTRYSTSEALKNKLSVFANNNNGQELSQADNIAGSHGLSLLSNKTIFNSISICSCYCLCALSNSH